VLGPPFLNGILIEVVDCIKYLGVCITSGLNSNEMYSIDPRAGFIYTTHPWLISLYLDCPLNLAFEWYPLECPSVSELQDSKTAVRKG